MIRSRQLKCRRLRSQTSKQKPSIKTENAAQARNPEQKQKAMRTGEIGTKEKRQSTTKKGKRLSQLFCLP